LLTELAKTFAPEMREVKGLAIGILMALVRDALKRSLGPELEKIVDRMTTKLGGVPLAEAPADLGAERVCEASGTGR
jgi:hypothetical protein